VNLAVKYAAGIATRMTIRVEDVATMSEVFSQFWNEGSVRTCWKAWGVHTLGRNVGGVASTSPLGRRASNAITMYGEMKIAMTPRPARGRTKRRAPFQPRRRRAAMGLVRTELGDVTIALLRAS
jgi:hypothetical protein